MSPICFNKSHPVCIHLIYIYKTTDMDTAFHRIKVFEQHFFLKNHVLLLFINSMTESHTES